MPRRLGQHFLSDPAILDRIVDALEPSGRETVLEIGAGRGTLTARLAPRVARVVAIERDRALARTLGEGEVGKREGGKALPNNVVIVHGDALRLDWVRLMTGATTAHSPLPVFKVTGNIPYAITSQLLDKALTPPVAELVVFLVQREVADRLTAQPGGKTYGALTVGIGVAATVERVFGVKAGAFRPPPKVDSAVVRLRPRATPLVPPARHPAFRGFVTALFGRRRKQLGTALRGVTGLSAPAVAATLDELGLDGAMRAERLPPQDFVRLFAEFG
ncbi:MAG: 16S rRNA (adenine(1518)-N(6)/adenine(1519)-N(6))-dimethyltransferase RsmA [Gemmatimonadales bacterium]